jgi:hypothetical protein
VRKAFVIATSMLFGLGVFIGAAAGFVYEGLVGRKD